MNKPRPSSGQKPDQNYRPDLTFDNSEPFARFSCDLNVPPPLDTERSSSDKIDLSIFFALDGPLPLASDALAQQKGIRVDGFRRAVDLVVPSADTSSDASVVKLPSSPEGGLMSDAVKVSVDEVRQNIPSLTAGPHPGSLSVPAPTSIISEGLKNEKIARDQFLSALRTGEIQVALDICKMHPRIDFQAQVHRAVFSFLGKDTVTKTDNHEVQRILIAFPDCYDSHFLAHLKRRFSFFLEITVAPMTAFQQPIQTPPVPPSTPVPQVDFENLPLPPFLSIEPTAILQASPALPSPLVLKLSPEQVRRNDVLSKLKAGDIEGVSTVVKQFDASAFTIEIRTAYSFHLLGNPAMAHQLHSAFPTVIDQGFVTFLNQRMQRETSQKA